ncbi:60S acidic ribosomal protein P1 [Neocucurbitaria cava]|uniref:Large ribosomal subunit protein P1 n=1 Tax=Neocucurbitaria cava TaxID=798079 RepID=A0A9W8Y9Q9_9PLEO|nr:60S acidic ribosomal protein P1 [Neocucurbitaria cava]
MVYIRSKQYFRHPNYYAVSSHLKQTSSGFKTSVFSMSTNKAEKAVAYASLILADESITITPEKLQALLKAAGIEDVEPIWTTLFAKALKDKDIEKILTTAAGSEPAAGGEAPGGATSDGHNEGASVLDDGTDVCDTDEDSDGGFGMDLFG